MAQTQDFEELPSSSAVADLSPDEQKETNCCGLCRCKPAHEPDEEEVESWEMSGKEACGCCPRCCHCPVGLGPRQCTWRNAEVTLWINLIFTTRTVVFDLMKPSWMNVFAFLLNGWVIGSLVVSFFSLIWVRYRDRKSMVQLFYCLLVVKITSIVFKELQAGIVTAMCSLNQSEFQGCKDAPELAQCLSINNCTESENDEFGCHAPGTDICEVMHSTFMSGWSIFWELFDLFGWLGGTLPVLFAGSVHYSRKRRNVHREIRRLASGAVQ